ncbi:unnamed protein product [Arctogadus glacialis]
MMWQCSLPVYAPQKRSRTRYLLLAAPKYPTDLTANHGKKQNQKKKEDVRLVQAQCRTCSDQLALSATQLRVELAALRQQAETVRLDMARVRRQLDQLMDIEAAFDTSVRTARKLSKLL